MYNVFILIFLAETGWIIAAVCIAILVIISLVHCIRRRICRGDEETDSDTGYRKTFIRRHASIEFSDFGARFYSRRASTFIPYTGPYTNHADRIWGNFDPPPSYVQTLYQPTKFHRMAKTHEQWHRDMEKEYKISELKK